MRKDFTSKFRDGAVENKMMDCLEEKALVEEYLKQHWNEVIELVRFGDINGLLKNYSLAAALTLGHLMRHAKSEKVRESAARELMHMEIGKPLQKSVNINKNFSSLDERELNSLLKSYIDEFNSDHKKLPSKVIDVKKDSEDI